MIAIRQIQKVKSGTITVQLPADFQAQEVEVIILPLERPASVTHDLRAKLLAAPTLTKEELQEYEKVREWMNQWNGNGS